MKESPIIFSAPMVQAILAGRKTQTRRPIKLKHFNGADIGSIHPDGSGKGWIAWSPNPVSAEETVRCYPGEDGFKCPFGIAGDLIYVREEHYRYGKWIKDGKTKKGNQKWKFIPIKNSSMQIMGLDPDTVYYNDDPPQAYRKSRDKDNPGKSQWYKRLSRFMPKSAARIWLEIESVRAERLTDISEEDAKAEGILWYHDERIGSRFKDYMADSSGYGHPEHDYPTVGNPVTSFGTLWAGINGADSWIQNPWVWVITFRILSKTGRTPLLSPLFPVPGKEKMIKK